MAPSPALAGGIVRSAGKSRASRAWPSGPVQVADIGNSIVSSSRLSSRSHASGVLITGDTRAGGSRTIAPMEVVSARHAAPTVHAVCVEASSARSLARKRGGPGDEAAEVRAPSAPPRPTPAVQGMAFAPKRRDVVKTSRPRRWRPQGLHHREPESAGDGNSRWFGWQKSVREHRRRRPARVVG